MNDFKPGDIAMIVKPMPCCGGGDLGFVFTVASHPYRCEGACSYCGTRSLGTVVNIAGTADAGGWDVTDTNRIIKIDRPAEGDSLPTRRDLEVAA